MFLYILNNFLIYTLLKLFYNHGTTTISLFIFITAMVSNCIWLSEAGILIVHKKIDTTLHRYKKITDVIETIALIVMIISKPILQVILKLTGQV